MRGQSDGLTMTARVANLAAVPVLVRRAAMTYPAVSLFSGAGIFDYGVSLAGFDIQAQVEIEPFCRKVLEKHKPQYWPNSTILEDVRNVGRHNLPASPALAYGGFPCTDISVAGKQAGIAPETRSGLWFEFARIIGEVRPRYVLLENVPAITGNGGLAVIGQLTSLGYDCEWGIISAADAGAPHLRERWWCVAHATGSGNQRQQRNEADSQRADRAGRSELRHEPGDSGQQLGDAMRLGRRQAGLQYDAGAQSTEGSAGHLGNPTSQGLSWTRQSKLSPVETQRGTGLVIQSERSGGELAHPDSQWQQQSQGAVSRFRGRAEHGSEEQRGVGQADPYGQSARYGHDGTPGVFSDSFSQNEGRGSSLPNQNIGDAFTSVGRAAIRITAGMDERLWPARPGEAQRSWERPRTTKAKVPDRASRLKALGNSGIWQIVYALATEIRQALETEDNAATTGGR